MTAAVQDIASAKDTALHARIEAAGKKPASAEGGDSPTKTKAQASQDAAASAAPPALIPYALPAPSVPAEAAAPSSGQAAPSSGGAPHIAEAAGRVLLASHHDSNATPPDQAPRPAREGTFAAALPATTGSAPQPAGQGMNADLAAVSNLASLRQESAAQDKLSGQAPAQPASAASSPAAQQTAAAMVSLGAGPDPGTQRVTIAMTPAELGHVTVQVDRLADGSSSVAVTATHAATLAALHGDRPALEQALTQAGIPLSHRTIEFRLETPAPSGGAAQFGASGSGGSMWSGAGSGQPGRQAPPGAAVTTIAAMGAEPDSAPLMRRFGINLTA